MQRLWLYLDEKGESSIKVIKVFALLLLLYKRLVNKITLKIQTNNFFDIKCLRHIPKNV